MPLSDTYPRGTVFVGRKTATGEGALEAGIDGTGFLVMIEGANPFHWHTYIVTAAHVVEGATGSFVRVTAWDLERLPSADAGEDLSIVEDVDIPRWIVHPDQTKDVAVCPIRLPERHHMVSTSIQQFVDDEQWENHKRGRWYAELGDQVFFIGLLGKIEAMTMGNVPMVRSGTLGRMWQERCPVRTRDDTIRYVTAHLIDCRSFGGFSGSPCYLQQGRAAVVPTEAGKPGINTEYRTALLGMIGGHYDDWLELRHSRGKSDLKYAVNTGVGYVIPAEFIRETLMLEELVQMRDDENARRTQRQEDGATMDAVPKNEPASEYDRFEALTTKLVQVPKAELDAERKQDEASG